jgi:hypothetical protein
MIVPIKLWFLIVVILCVANPSAAQAEKRRQEIGILVDTTGSLRPQLEREITIAREIVRKMNDGTLFSLYSFVGNSKSANNRFEVSIECADKNSIEGEIDNLYIPPGETALYDAMKSSADRLNRKNKDGCAATEHSKLIVITDGQDTASALKPAEAIGNLKAFGITTYVIGLLDGLPRDGNSLQKEIIRKSRLFLEDAARETGGKAVFPNKNQSAEEIVKELFR